MESIADIAKGREANTQPVIEAAGPPQNNAAEPLIQPGIAPQGSLTSSLQADPRQSGPLCEVCVGCGACGSQSDGNSIIIDVNPDTQNVGKEMAQFLSNNRQELASAKDGDPVSVVFPTGIFVGKKVEGNIKGIMWDFSQVDRQAAAQYADPELRLVDLAKGRRDANEIAQSDIELARNRQTDHQKNQQEEDRPWTQSGQRDNRTPQEPLEKAVVSSNGHKDEMAEQVKLIEVEPAVDEIVDKAVTIVIGRTEGPNVAELREQAETPVAPAAKSKVATDKKPATAKAENGDSTAETSNTKAGRVEDRTQAVRVEVENQVDAREKLTTQPVGEQDTTQATRVGLYELGDKNPVETHTAVKKTPKASDGKKQLGRRRVNSDLVSLADEFQMVEDKETKVITAKTGETAGKTMEQDKVIESQTNESQTKETNIEVLDGENNHRSTFPMELHGQVANSLSDIREEESPRVEKKEEKVIFSAPVIIAQEDKGSEEQPANQGYAGKKTVGDKITIGSEDINDRRIPVPRENQITSEPDADALTVQVQVDKEPAPTGKEPIAIIEKNGAIIIGRKPKHQENIGLEKDETDDVKPIATVKELTQVIDMINELVEESAKKMGNEQMRNKNSDVKDTPPVKHTISVVASQEVFTFIQRELLQHAKEINLEGAQIQQRIQSVAHLGQETDTEAENYSIKLVKSDGINEKITLDLPELTYALERYMLSNKEQLKEKTGQESVIFTFDQNGMAELKDVGLYEESNGEQSMENGQLISALLRIDEKGYNNQRNGDLEREEIVAVSNENVIFLGRKPMDGPKSQKEANMKLEELGSLETIEELVETIESLNRTASNALNEEGVQGNGLVSDNVSDGEKQSEALMNVVILVSPDLLTVLQQAIRKCQQDSSLIITGNNEGTPPMYDTHMYKTEYKRKNSNKQYITFFSSISTKSEKVIIDYELLKLVTQQLREQKYLLQVLKFYIAINTLKKSQSEKLYFGKGTQAPQEVKQNIQQAQNTNDGSIYWFIYMLWFFILTILRHGSQNVK